MILNMVSGGGGGIEPFTKTIYDGLLSGTQTIQLERLPTVVIFNRTSSSTKAWACYVHTDGTVNNIGYYEMFSIGYVQSADVENKTIKVYADSGIYVKVLG